MAPSVLLFAQVPERSPAPAEVVAEKGEEVGISATDGISVSGKDTLVTRNGVSERLTKGMELANGTRVQPDGSITLPDGSKITLKGNQVLTFAGVVRDVPPRENATARTVVRETVVKTAPVPNAPPAESITATVVEEASAFPDGVLVNNGVPYLIRKGRASVIDSKLVPQGQILTHDGRFAPIPPTFTDFPPTVPVQRGTDQQTRIGEPGPTQAVPGQKGTPQQTRIGEPGTPVTPKRNSTSGN